jgi:tRNA threonylcarbamoyladenosine biosynthesis protein TsaE
MDIEYELSDINKTAEKMWSIGRAYKIWAFHGGMGCGKTSFIHSLCKLLQVEDVISSPTFAIVNEYRSNVYGTIYHMDWYRLKDEEEAMQAGIEDCLTSGNICLIEWPEKASGLLTDNVLHIYISMIDENTRKVHVQTSNG